MTTRKERWDFEAISQSRALKEKMSRCKETKCPEHKRVTVDKEQPSRCAHFYESYHKIWAKWLKDHPDVWMPTYEA